MRVVNKINIAAYASGALNASKSFALKVHARGYLATKGPSIFRTPSSGQLETLSMPHSWLER